MSLKTNAFGCYSSGIQTCAQQAKSNLACQHIVRAFTNIMWLNSTSEAWHPVLFSIKHGLLSIWTWKPSLIFPVSSATKKSRACKRVIWTGYIASPGRCRSNSSHRTLPTDDPPSPPSPSTCLSSFSCPPFTCFYRPRAQMSRVSRPRVSVLSLVLSLVLMRQPSDWPRLDWLATWALLSHQQWIPECLCSLAH